MHNAFFMRRGECVGQSCRNLDDLCGGEATGRNAAIQRLSFDQFHGEEMNAVRFFDGENRHDVRVIQRSHGSSFTLEAGESLGIARRIGGKYFEGNVSSKLGVSGAIHLTHATGADGACNSVMR